MNKLKKSNCNILIMIDLQLIIWAAAGNSRAAAGNSILNLLDEAISGITKN